eukprot:TRINITY_DN4983_c0_g2_i4.p2 TRINITY_DN4983_c0_g2~~TRINITY_DN4983_c0_g2_i4.p2  ORF type:complete len:125 (-),score=1.74 TRINITY_DN4983_c0_g2_i4:121-495(-)
MVGTMGTSRHRSRIPCQESQLEQRPKSIAIVTQYSPHMMNNSIIIDCKNEFADQIKMWKEQSPISLSIQRSKLKRTTILNRMRNITPDLSTIWKMIAISVIKEYEHHSTGYQEMYKLGDFIFLW